MHLSLSDIRVSSGCAGKLPQAPDPLLTSYTACTFVECNLVTLVYHKQEEMERPGEDNGDVVPLYPCPKLLAFY